MRIIAIRNAEYINFLILAGLGPHRARTPLLFRLAPREAKELDTYNKKVEGRDLIKQSISTRGCLLNT